MDGSTRKSGTCGFTLIEMTVVITILALFAALVFPNMVAIQRSQQARRIKASIFRLPAEARGEARRAKCPVSLRVDGDEIVMERHPIDLATTSAGTTIPGMSIGGSKPSGINSMESPEEVKRLGLGDAFQVTKARQGADSTDLASWQWMAYPDGSSDDASLEFKSGNLTQTLVIPHNGDAHWVDGEEPDTENDRWDAGELQSRAQ